MKHVSEPNELFQNLSSRWSFRDASLERVRGALERVPSIYIPIAQRRNQNRKLLDGTVDLLVEGYPRSGNTFLFSYISITNAHITVASHLHSAAHVRAALRRKVPVVIVIRAPQAAIASEIINRLGRDIRENATRLFRRYERLYSFCIAQSDRLTISPFEVTTHHPELVVSTLRDRSGLELNLATAEQRNEILSEVERLNALHVGQPNELTVARPSEARAELADRIKQYLAENHASTLARLQELHDKLAACPTALHADSGTPPDQP